MKDKNEKKHSTLKIQMPISYCVCPGIQKERDIRTIKERYWGEIEKLCEQKGVEITEAEACPDHIHMPVSISPHLSISQFMGYLKGKSSLMIFDRHANSKYKYGSRNFWCSESYVDTVSRNKKVIAEYIRKQSEENYTPDQMSIKEYKDPFTGSKENKA